MYQIDDASSFESASRNRSDLQTQFDQDIQVKKVIKGSGGAIGGSTENAS